MAQAARIPEKFMPTRPRVFISSTMEDLGNERQAVASEIEALGFTPVNAEALMPTGGSSWDVLQDEIASSHIFVLILGDRYGWAPDRGYGAGSKKSVTHLEFELAVKSQLTILPFFKRLKYRSGPAKDEELSRDSFRNEVGDWANGRFRAEFDLAVDLGRAVRAALIDLLLGSFEKASIRKHDAALQSPADLQRQIQFQSARGKPSSNSVLFAGAGLSLAAGYPSANILAEAFGQQLSLDAQTVGRYPLADIAALLEEKLGRRALLETVNRLLDTPLPVDPTISHFACVQEFDVILTTNYDLLFEEACRLSNLSFSVRTPGRKSGEKADVSIFKLDGSIDQPETLVLTSGDAARAREDESFWNDLQNILNERRPFVIGHSLRDDTSKRVLGARNQALSGTYVSPHLTELDTIYLKRFGLVAKEITLEELSSQGRLTQLIQEHSA